MSVSVVESRERLAHVSKKQRRKPIFQWLFYALVMLSVFGLLTGRFFYRGMVTDETGLCAVILALFCAALLKNLYDIFYIDYEITIAHTQVNDLIAAEGIKSFLASADESLLREHVINLYEIARRGSEVSQDNLVVLLQSRINARLRITEIAGSLLVTLGLVGTIVGLIGSFAGIDVVMSNVGEDKALLLGGFKETLGGMGTAFYTTLLGSILGGVILRVLTSVVDSNADSLVAQIAELCEVYILPSFRKVARRQADRDAGDQR